MRIIDRGNGWQVEAEWFGEIRVVFTGGTADPWIQLADCRHFVAGTWG